MRTRQDQHLEIPGVSNNTTETLEQKKTNSWTPVINRGTNDKLECASLLFQSTDTDPIFRGEIHSHLM